MNNLNRLPVGPALILLWIISGTTAVRADDDSNNVDGNTGVIHVYGQLVKGACNIETGSAQQTIDLGSVSEDMLLHPGDTAPGKKVDIHLTDCISNEVEEAVSQEGNITRITDEPLVEISIAGTTDGKNPALIRVFGAEGFGLLVEDSEHHAITPGTYYSPAVLSRGSDTLSYWLKPERTGAALKYGSWRSTLYVKFNYD